MIGKFFKNQLTSIIFFMVTLLFLISTGIYIYYIDNLYTIMLQKFNSISLATIYKNINLMIENAFIQEVKIPHEKSVYELAKTTHSHLVCNKCGEIEDIHLDLTALAESAAQSSRFQIDKADLVLSGICQKCQQL